MNNNCHQIAAKTVQLSPSTSPGYTHAGNLSAESAEKASELLNANHTLYHTRFNGGFHNHITHHILALWSLGASPDEMQDMFEFNKLYQAPLEQSDTGSLGELNLKNPDIFGKSLGNNDCYFDFLKFFEDEIAEKGMPAVVREYVLKGDDRANDIFCRMYTDLVHPIIHLGYALEYNQPSLVAEALAAACVHDDWPKDFILPTEDYLRSNADVPSKPFLQILNDLRQDPEISSAVRDTDPFNKIRDGFHKRVTGEQIAPYLSQFQVRPDPKELQSKMEEMMYTCAYIMGAAQRPGKRERMDFVLVHNVTLSVFYPAILALDWMTNQEKARFIEAKARIDAVMYGACKCPELYPARIVDYLPRHPGHGWTELFHRSNIYYDEGHAVKLIRALFSLEQLGDTAPGFPLKKSDFVKIAHMAMDSIESALEKNGHKIPEKLTESVTKNVGQGGEMVASNMMRWVFYGGLSNAWNFVPDLQTSAS